MLGLLHAVPVNIVVSRQRVFFDANIVIGWGRPPWGPFETLNALYRAGLLDVVTTDVTIIEVAKNLAEKDCRVLKPMGSKQFREAAALVGWDPPEFDAAAFRLRQYEHYRNATTGMFRRLGCEVLAVDEARPSTVFADYGAGEGFFASQGKKGQYADAFVFELLKNVARPAYPILVVSKDRDFEGPVNDEPNIGLVTSMQDFYRSVGRKVDCDGLEGFLLGDDTYEVLMAEVRRETAASVLMSATTDVEIVEADAQRFDLLSWDSFDLPGVTDSVLVTASLRVEADVRYTHPDWDSATWDSEDKVAIPRRDVEAESGASFEVDVAIRIGMEHRQPTTVEDFRYTELRGLVAIEDVL